MIRRLSFLFSLVLLFALVSSPAQATTSEALFTTGRQLFDQGRFDEAYTELHKAFQQDPANLEINFYLGRAAFESGRLEEAVMAFDRILIADPDAQRVKLELARAHLRLGSRELAKQYFKEVQATNPPEQVWQNIQQFLDAIAASEKQHFLNGTFTLGHAWDDNARSAPVSDRISMGLFEFTLTGQSAKPQNDQVNTTTLVLNHLYKNDDYPFVWKTSATSYNALYGTLYDLDINYLGLTTGPVFQQEKFIWDMQLLASSVDVEHDRYQSSFGAATSCTVLVMENLLATFGIKVEEKNNYADPERDATNLQYSSGPVLIEGPNRVSLTFTKEAEIAYNEVNSYDRFGWKMRYDRELPYDLALSASFGYTDTSYDAIHPFFQEWRSDEVKEVVAGLSRVLWKDPAKGQVLVAQLNHTYTDSVSNIDLYTYRKNVTELSLTAGF
ncbi:MAG: porin family protein [Thermodesulfobacteriota bacterium]